MMDTAAFCAVCADDCCLGLDDETFCSNEHLERWLGKRDPPMLAFLRAIRFEGKVELERMRAAGETAQEIALRQIKAVLGRPTFL